MAKFLLDNAVEIITQVNKTTVGYLVDFSLPEEIKEKIPMDEVRLINGIFLMRFYSDPLPGDKIIYRGFQWRVIERIFYPTRYNNRREDRKVPLLKVEFLGASPIE